MVLLILQHIFFRFKFFTCVDVGAFCFKIFLLTLITFDHFFMSARIVSLMWFHFFHVSRMFFPDLLLHCHDSVSTYRSALVNVFFCVLVFPLVHDFAVTFLIPWCMF